MIEYRSLRVALLGGGTVGANVARRLIDHSDELAARVGAHIDLIGVAVRDVKATRSPAIPAHLLTTDAESLILGADIVIEVMGGIEPARTYITQALQSGADVVTANKALLANHGTELFALAEQVGAQLYYEAAVAGAIPIIRPLRDSLAGDNVTRIMGIVNGTTNYILDRMDTEGSTFDEALAVATELGYAEADPTADVDGFDAAQKAAILASLAFHTTIDLASVYREGIRGVSGEVIALASKAGYAVKLLAIAERLDNADDDANGVSVRVYPALIPRSHPLASVRGANNAVFVEAEGAGSLMFYGAGAGGPETASAVLGDLVSAARRHVIGGPGLAESTHANLAMLPVSAITTSYHVTLEVADEPGVLASIASVFANHSVSVELVEQGIFTSEGSAASKGQTATLVIGTHRARESDLAATVADLAELKAVTSVTSVLRIEGS
jgi:homoserine dehydrogenase